MNCGCEATTRTGLLDLFDARTRMIDPDTLVEEGHAYAYCPGAQFLD
ncbi:hypothetical protein [Halomonas stenophila]|uniref:Uncharacterized protein n=1 Tax=Halomonas stenophila TaxID=795312 RepID=A0A7W5HKQ1_9GAMM|nr:hypothetical protein [Halomonas stenophila]MBB3230741.1 hypothetical protein [Halomonas stenophila]